MSRAYKNEAAFWGALRKRLEAAGWLAWKIPAELRTGLPDTFIAKDSLAAWVELKYVPAWPVRPTTPVTAAVTPEQSAHLTALREAGVPAYVLLGVAEWWFLLRAVTPDQRYVKAELMRPATAVGWGHDLHEVGSVLASAIAGSASVSSAQ